MLLLLYFFSKMFKYNIDDLDFMEFYNLSK